MKNNTASTLVDRVFRKSRLTVWLVVFLFLTLLALMNFMRFVTSELAEGKPGKFRFYLIMETTGAYTLLFLLPLLLLFFKKFPIKRRNLHTHIPLYILASMVYGVCHTMLMYLSRTLIYWLARMGTYNYGRMEYRFPMEYSHQFFTFWLIFGVVFIVKSVQEYQEQKLRASQLEQQLTKARLQALQMQIHPHFLFNTLNMISSTMYENVKIADRMIANLSDLLRITLNSERCEVHSLEKELEFVKLYIEIMRARFKDKLDIHMDVSSETLDVMVPTFILQPLVENSIRHSMENLKTTKIKIKSRKEKDRMTLVLEDNGPGISGDLAKIIKNGVGLSNTVERLEKLYGTNQSFHLQNISGGGLQIVMEIPFQLSSGEEYSDERH